MSKQNLLNVVAALIAADVPTLLWGPPGVGKTAQIMKLAEDEGAHVEVLIGSTLDPTDVGGWLLPTEHGVRQSPPPWAQRMRAVLAQGKPAWLFLDELSCAPPMVQAALLRVVQERRVADLDLRGSRVIAASNPSDTAADGGSLAAATANRWAHLQTQVDSAVWCRGELTGWGKGLSRASANSAPNIIAYIERNSNALLQVPKGMEQRGGAWPSPRSWSAAIRGIGHAKRETWRAIVASCVGDGAASEWYTWLEANDLPGAEDILDHGVAWPKRGDQISIVASSVVAYAIANDRVPDAWAALSGLRPDTIALAARALIDGGGEEQITTHGYELGRRILEAERAIK